ncbi:MAG TPA: carboxypeptidase regulatory-like domain-containing protein [Tepidisphaeraceae bacterium]|jgi:beta-lactamase regulating signal transducer with metallopeptidase domain/protocatechuate 3,4-dioxygenase beta subunit
MTPANQILTRLADGLFDASLKAAFVLTAAFAIAFLFRRRSAALRHLIWVLAITVTILVPICSALSPQWQIAVMPSGTWLDHESETLIESSQINRTPIRAHIPESTLPKAEPSTSALGPAPTPAFSPHVQSETSHNLKSYFILTWLIGMALVGFTSFAGMLAIRRISARAVVDVDSDLARLLSRLAKQVRISRQVSLLWSGDCSMPMTWGSARPKLMLPLAAKSWPAEQLRTVLLHELAHVQRFDHATQLLAHLSCALYWFNPLAWIAQSRLRSEQERACDDAVLTHGIHAPDYARDLLAIVRSLQPNRVASLSAVTMARRSQLPERLTAILNDRVNRSSLNRRRIVFAVLIAMIAFGLLSTARLLPARRAQAASGKQSDHVMLAEDSAMANSGTSVLADPSEAGTGRAVDLLVVNSKTHDPIVGAAIDVGAYVMGGSNKWTGTTDRDGKFRITLEGPMPGNVRVGVAAPGYAPRAIQWPLVPGARPLPASFTMELEPGITIGGVVHDEHGAPVAGVKISFIVTSQSISGPYGTFQYATTDDHGKWEIHDAPTDLRAIELDLDHPQYAHTSAGKSASREELIARTAALVIETGIRLTGVISDEAAHPIANATVSSGRTRGDERTVTTGPDGKYALAITPESQTLTVWAPLFAPQARNVSEANAGVMNFKLSKGNKLSGRVVDRSGNPVPETFVSILQWGANRRLEWYTKTDENGRFAWLDAPDTQVTLRFQKESFMNAEPTLAPGPAEHTITLPAGLRLKGSVADALTGKPIVSFEIIDGYRLGARPTIAWESFYPSRRYANVSGAFDHLVRPGPYAGYEIRILAPGYASQESRVLAPEEGAISIDFKLTPKAGTDGTLLTPDAKPAANAEIYAVSPGGPTRFENGRFDETFPRIRVREVVRQAARPDGGFAFPADVDPQATYVAIHPTGYTFLNRQILRDAPQARLSPWGTLEGTLFTDGKPDSAKPVMLQPQKAAPSDAINLTYRATTDANGHFRFDRIMAGSFTISRAQPGDGQWFHPAGEMIPLEIAPGANAPIDLGRTGRLLVGELSVPADVKPQDFQVVSLVLSPIPPRVPRQTYAGIANPDGTFEISDVPPGQYQLSLMAMIKPRSSRTNQPITGSKSIYVPATGSGSLDVGTLNLISHPSN